MSDTPRTDAQHAKWRIDDDPYTDMMKLARQLERELLRASVDAARWKIAIEYMTAHNRSIVEGLIPWVLPEQMPEAEFESYAAPGIQVEFRTAELPRKQPKVILGGKDETTNAAPQGQEVCQHARLPNDRVPEPAVAARISARANQCGMGPAQAEAFMDSLLDSNVFLTRENIERIRDISKNQLVKDICNLALSTLNTRSTP